MAHQVTCINKRDHYSPYERIERIGGATPPATLRRRTAALAHCGIHSRECSEHIALSDDLEEPPSLAAKSAAALMNKCNPYGPLHAVIDDGNMEDRNLDAVESEPLSDTERQCLNALRALPEEQRYAAWEEADRLYREELLKGNAT